MKKSEIDEQEIIKENIDTLMRERGWSPKVLAERSGVAVGTIYNLRSTRAIGDGVLFKIARALDTTPEALRGIEQTPADADSVAILTQDEQDVLNYMRRLSPTSRRRAARLLRQIVDELEESERAATEKSTATPAPSTPAGAPKPKVA